MSKSDLNAGVQNVAYIEEFYAAYRNDPNSVPEAWRDYFAAAENGATQAQLKAIYGWTSDAVAAIYIRDADRARLAQDGMAMLTKTGTSIPEPKDKVRAARRKSK